MRRFTELQMPQRSLEWHQARCGLLTGTAAADMLATLKGSGEAAARRDLRLRLVVERLTGSPQEDGFVNYDMKRGADLEAEARAAYEALTGTLVRTAGFLKLNDSPVGYSPDGIIGDFTGLLELKVPRSATHLRYIRSGGLPAEHQPQVLHGLYVTGASFCEFCSYDPRFPPELRIYRVRVERNEFDLMVYQRTVETFLEEVEKELQDVQALVTAAA